jgi:hypothetical protein
VNATVLGRRVPRSWPVLLLAAPAFVAIWSGWVGLGSLTGFGKVHPLPGIWDAATINSAITLPVGVETYAAYALHVWLARGVDARATRFAKYSALGSLALGAGGQVAYHLMVAAGITQAPWQITAVVACLPVAVLGMGAALAHLVTDSTDATSVGDTAPGEADTTTTDSGVVTDAAPADPTVATSRPAPPPRTTARRTVAAAGPGSVAVKVRRLREKHPDWTLTQIGEKAGCAERTVRRHLNATPPAATPPVAAPPVASAAVVSADDGQVAA